MDIRNTHYQSGLKLLRYMILCQGVILLALSLLFGRINGFVFVFVMLTSIFLFCDINIKHTYQLYIVIGIFVLVKEMIQFLVYLFYKTQQQKQERPVVKIIVLYVLSIIVILKVILVTWRHYQNKMLEHAITGENVQFMEEF